MTILILQRGKLRHGEVRGLVRGPPASRWHSLDWYRRMSRLGSSEGLTDLGVRRGDVRQSHSLSYFVPRILRLLVHSTEVLAPYNEVSNACVCHSLGAETPSPAAGTK